MSKAPVLVTRAEARRAVDDEDIGMLWDVVRPEIVDANPSCSWCGAAFKGADRSSSR